MRIDLRQLLVALCFAGLAGAALFLPAVSWVGDLLAPSHPAPAAIHVPPLLGDAIWARANGGRASALLPLHPVTIARMVGCHVVAEWQDPAQRDHEHDECMTLLPAIEAVGYLAKVHMQSEGVWQDPRVPFVQVATMTRVTSRWTRAELVDTLAARGEFGPYFTGAEHAARGLFGRSLTDLTVPQAALVAAVLGNRRADPWCEPAAAARMRSRILERMRNNGAIDDTQYQAALAVPLELQPPPAESRCR